MQTVMRYDGVGTPMTAIALTPEGCVLAGGSKGALIMCACLPAHGRKCCVHTPCRTTACWCGAYQWQAGAAQHLLSATWHVRCSRATIEVCCAAQVLSRSQARSTGPEGTASACRPEHPVSPEPPQPCGATAVAALSANSPARLSVPSIPWPGSRPCTMEPPQCVTRLSLVCSAEPACGRLNLALYPPAAWCCLFVCHGNWQMQQQQHSVMTCLPGWSAFSSALNVQI